jgi:hypothetical protein
LPFSSFSVSSGPSGSVFSHSVPGEFFGERVIDREQDAVDAHLHHAPHKRGIRKEAARRDPGSHADQFSACDQTSAMSRRGTKPI